MPFKEIDQIARELGQRLPNWKSRIRYAPVTVSAMHYDRLLSVATIANRLWAERPDGTYSINEVTLKELGQALEELNSPDAEIMGPL